MFFNDSLLSKRNGPLAKVWLASHMGDKKLSKAQLLGTSIPKSVGAIMGSETIPMALRLSGQLLLGVARIYSRKAKYLVDDCNDALTKIKMTFRPGATVDMGAEQVQASTSAITRQDQPNEFDLLYQDVELDFWNPDVYEPKATPGRGVAIARDADITRRDEDDDFEFQMPRIEFGDDLLGGGQAIELDDFGVGFATGHKRAREDDESDVTVEYGRDGNQSSARLSNRMSGGDANTYSENEQVFMNDYGGGDEGYGMEPDYSMGPPQFGDRTLDSQGDFDLSGVLDAHEDGPFDPRQGTPAIGGLDDGQRTPRAASPAPAQEGEQLNGDQDFDVTPRTAKRVADNAALDSAKKRRAANKPKGGKQIVDASTELAGGRGSGSQAQAARATDPSLLIAPQYLPASRAQMRLWRIEQDPAAYYLPRTLPNGKVYVGPPDLVPELAAMFEITALTKSAPAAKRARLTANGVNGSDEASVEVGRRDENGRLSDRFSVGDMEPPSFDDWDPNTLMDREGGGGGDYGDGVDMPLDYSPGPLREKSSTPAPHFFNSRGATPLPADLFSTPVRQRGTGEGLLDIFDTVPQSESSQRTQTQEHEQERQAASSGWSKNTIRAVRVLNEELGPAPIEGEEVSDKTLSFDTAAEEASRSAAAAFFFELLVLGSRGCIDVKQTEAYGDISISAKPKLWDVVNKSDMARTTSSIAGDSSSPTRTPVAGR